MNRPLVRCMFVIGILSMGIATQVWGVEPDEMLDNSALEARARVISQDLRCVVCQNEAIDESNATLAQDMRRLVRQRVKSGDTNEEVIAYMVDRYGDFVLLRPRVAPLTWLLWFGPLVLLALGAFVVAQYMRRPAATEIAPLSDSERDQVNGLLSDDRDRS